MTGGLVEQAARAHNRALTGFVNDNNAGHMRSEEGHIYDLSKGSERRFLRDSLGIGVDALTLSSKDMAALGDTYSREKVVREWANIHLKEGSIDYIGDFGLHLGVCPIPNRLKPLLSRVIQAEEVQGGMCVVGENEADDIFEGHPVGNEGLIPELFHGLTLLTQGYDERKRTIDARKEVAVFMPSDGRTMYILNATTDPKGYMGAGHYAPHVLALMRVLLPRHTNEKPLTEADKARNRAGKITTARNKILAERNPRTTRARVIGSSPAALDVIKIAQEIADITARPFLDQL